MDSKSTGAPFETPFPAFDSQLNDEPAPLTNIKFHLLTFLQVLFSKKKKQKKKYIKKNLKPKNREPNVSLL